MSENDGFVLLALFLVPLGSMVVLMMIPSRERGAIIGFTGAASLLMFGLAVYSFASYSFTSPEQFQGVKAWNWVENAGCWAITASSSRSASTASAPRWCC